MFFPSCVGAQTSCSPISLSLKQQRSLFVVAGFFSRWVCVKKLPNQDWKQLSQAQHDIVVKFTELAREEAEVLCPSVSVSVSVFNYCLSSTTNTPVFLRSLPRPRRILLLTCSRGPPRSFKKLQPATWMKRPFPGCVRALIFSATTQPQNRRSTASPMSCLA